MCASSGVGGFKVGRDGAIGLTCENVDYAKVVASSNLILSSHYES